MRSRRSALDVDAVSAASSEVVRRLQQLPQVDKANLIAAYHGIHGEILLEELIEANGRFTVPRVVGDAIEFVIEDPDLNWRSGSFGISEPVGGRVVDLAEHDVVLVPLVAFDRGGYRVGQGGGFYDRALAPLLDLPSRPFLLGIAHEFQRLERLPRHPWDVALDAVVTEVAVHVVPQFDDGSNSHEE